MLVLTRTPDVLAATIDDRAPGAVIVGFALETNDVVEYAQAKLRDKALDLVVANPAGEPGAGFGTDTNRVVLIGADGEIETLPLMSKDDVAERLWDRVGGLLRGR